MWPFQKSNPSWGIPEIREKVRKAKYKENLIYYMKRLWPRLKVIIIVSLSFLVALIVIILLVAGLYPLTNRQIDAVNTTESISYSIGILDLVLSTILTSALIYVYWDIRQAEQGQEKLMEKQAKIIEGQRELRRATIQPDLIGEVDSSKLIDDQVFVTCHNDGPGRASSIEFDLNLFVHKNDFHVIRSLEGASFTPLSQIGEVREIEPPTGPVEEREVFQEVIPYVKYVSEDTIRGGKQAVVEGNSSQEFRFTVRVRHAKGVLADPHEGQLKSLETITNRLDELGCTAIAYQLYIEYKNILGEVVNRSGVSSGIAELNPEMTFADIYESSQGGYISFELGNTEVHQATFEI